MNRYCFGGVCQMVMDSLFGFCQTNLNDILGQTAPDMPIADEQEPATRPI